MMDLLGQVLVWVLGLALAVGGGLLATVTVLGLAARTSGEGAPDARVTDADADAEAGADADVAGQDRGPTSARARAALRGGTWIGILERIAVTGTLLAGYPAGIALVVAIKGLGRYPELRGNPDASERFVIGTFTSLIVAAAVGVVGRALLV